MWDAAEPHDEPAADLRLGRHASAPAPPNQRYPGWLNINRTQDVAASITKVMGRHTLKAGFYNNHSFKAQNVGAGGGLSFQGTVDFGNDTNNALDTGFGYANAYTGVFTRYQQASDFIEGQMVYDNTEFYIQDNWKVNSRMTLDYGVRFTHQRPQYDKNQQMSNFFPEQWNAAQAQTLYMPGCSNGAAICSGNTLNAMDPRNGQILTVPGTSNTQAAIGTPIPGSGNPLNGIRQAGDGIAKTGYTWPAIVVGPRFGVAYDISGNQMTVHPRRRRHLLRPSGRQHRLLDPGQPADRELRGPAQRHAADRRPGPQHPAEPAAGDVPVRGEGAGTVAVAGGRAARAAVGHGHRPVVRRQPRLQPDGRASGRLDRQPELDRPRHGLPAEESGYRRRAPSTVPGATALTTNLLRPYQGLANINQNTTEFWDTYHSLQASLNRRFRNGFSFGANYTYGISYKGNTRPAVAASSTTRTAASSCATTRPSTRSSTRRSTAVRTR